MGRVEAGMTREPSVDSAMPEVVVGEEGGCGNGTVGIVVLCSLAGTGLS